MKIKQLTIDNIGGISHLVLGFNDTLNLLCGPNGVGKTTILECIGHSFSNTRSNILKKKKDSEKGIIKLDLVGIDENTSTSIQEIEISEYHPHEQDHTQGLYQHSDKILFLKTNRHFEYKNLTAVSKDQEKGTGKTRNEAYRGINYNDIKDWFIQRIMWEPHENGLSKTQIYNLNLARNSFNNLDNNIKFSRIISDTYDIVLDTPQGEIYYEYLSSGYKSCLSIILGLIKEIEFRFKDPRIRADEFEGIILIDEFDLHLHPKWQGKISRLVTETFPKAQIIAATHSPHMIQTSKPDEIIPLEFGDKGKVSIRKIESVEYGYQGWTVQEILRDVMGMEDTHSQKYQDLTSAFFKSVDDGNKEEAQKLKEELNKILHPNNYLRKIIDLELTSFQ